MTVGTLLIVSEAIEADAMTVPLPWNLVPVLVRVREDEESVGTTVLETVMVPVASSTVPVVSGSEDDATTLILVRAVEDRIVVEYENKTVGCADAVELAATVGTTMRVLALAGTEVGSIVIVVVENLRRRRVTVVVM